MRVYLPDYNNIYVDFPDDTPQDQIKQTLEQNFPDVNKIANPDGSWKIDVSQLPAMPIHPNNNPPDLPQTLGLQAQQLQNQTQQQNNKVNNMLLNNNTPVQTQQDAPPTPIDEIKQGLASGFRTLPTNALLNYLEKPANPDATQNILQSEMNATGITRPQLTESGNVQNPTPPARPVGQGIYQGSPTLLDLIKQKVGIQQPKTTPLDLEAIQKNENPYDIRQNVFGTGKEEELRRIIGQATSGFSGGLTDLVQGGEQLPTTQVGQVAGSLAKLGGFVAGPVQAAKTITTLEPVVGESVAKNITRGIAQDALTLGTATALSEGTKALDTQHPIEQTAKNFGVGALTGSIYNLTRWAKVPSAIIKSEGMQRKIADTAVRVATAMVGMDAMRSAESGQPVGLIANAQGQEDPRDLTQKVYDKAMDTLFVVMGGSVDPELVHLSKLANEGKIDPNIPAAKLNDLINQHQDEINNSTLEAGGGQSIWNWAKKKLGQEVEQRTQEVNKPKGFEPAQPTEQNVTDRLRWLNQNHTGLRNIASAAGVKNYEIQDSITNILQNKSAKTPLEKTILNSVVADVKNPGVIQNPNAVQYYWDNQQPTEKIAMPDWVKKDTTLESGGFQTLWDWAKSKLGQTVQQRAEEAQPKSEPLPEPPLHYIGDGVLSPESQKQIGVKYLGSMDVKGESIPMYNDLETDSTFMHMPNTDVEDQLWKTREKFGIKRPEDFVTPSFDELHNLNFDSYVDNSTPDIIHHAAESDEIKGGKITPEEVLYQLKRLNKHHTQMKEIGDVVGVKNYQIQDAIHGILRRGPITPLEKTIMDVAMRNARTNNGFVDADQITRMHANHDIEKIPMPDWVDKEVTPKSQPVVKQPEPEPKTLTQMTNQKLADWSDSVKVQREIGKMLNQNPLKVKDSMINLSMGMDPKTDVDRVIRRIAIESGDQPTVDSMRNALNAYNKLKVPLDVGMKPDEIQKAINKLRLMKNQKHSAQFIADSLSMRRGQIEDAISEILVDKRPKTPLEQTILRLIHDKIFTPKLNREYYSTNLNVRKSVDVPMQQAIRETYDHFNTLEMGGLNRMYEAGKKGIADYINKRASEEYQKSIAPSAKEQYVTNTKIKAAEINKEKEAGQKLQDMNKRQSMKNSKKLSQDTLAGRREQYRLDNKENIKKYSTMDAEPDDRVTIYRVGKRTIHVGEYVTTNKENAVNYAAQRSNAELYKLQVSVKDLVHGLGKKDEFIYSPASAPESVWNPATQFYEDADQLTGHHMSPTKIQPDAVRYLRDLVSEGSKADEKVNTLSKTLGVDGDGIREATKNMLLHDNVSTPLQKVLHQIAVENLSPDSVRIQDLMKKQFGKSTVINYKKGNNSSLAEIVQKALNGEHLNPDEWSIFNNATDEEISNAGTVHPHRPEDFGGEFEKALKKAGITDTKGDFAVIKDKDGNMHVEYFPEMVEVENVWKPWEEVANILQGVKPYPVYTLTKNDKDKTAHHEFAPQAGFRSTERESKGAWDGQMQKRSDIVNFLEEKLDVPIRTGKFRGQGRGVRGIFKPREEVIRSKYTNDIDTIAHEIGHGLHKYLWGMRDQVFKPYLEEFNNISDYAQTKPSEGFAEFVREYITNPEKVKKDAPSFYDFFESEVKKKSPESLDILQDARKQYERWQNQPALQKVLSQISTDEKKAPANTLDKVYTNTMDESYLIKKAVDEMTGGKELPVDEDPYKLIRLHAGWVGKADAFLENGTFDYNTLKTTGKGLKEILNPVKNNLDELRAYLVAKRAIELNGRGSATGISTKDAKQVVLDLSNKYEGVAKELQQYQNAVLKYLQDAGIISASDAFMMQEMNKNYVPFYRTMDPAASGGTGKGFEANNPVRRIKGSWRDIVDPLESIIKNTYSFINLAEKNAVGKALVKLGESTQGTGKFIEHIPTPIKRTKASMEEVNTPAMKLFRTMLEENGMDAATIRKIMKDQTFTIFRPDSFTPQKDVIGVWRGGKKDLYQVSPEIYTAFKGLDRESANMLVKILAYPAKWLRAGATLNPDFIARNPMRDQFSAFVYSKYGFVPGYDFVRGLFHVAKQDDLYWQWKKSGGEHSMMVSLDREYLSKNLKDLMATKEKALKNVVKSPLKMLQILSEVMEEGTRVGEFARGVKKEGISKEGIQKAGYASREVTLDFNRMGAKTKAVNSIIAFWNANIQGIDKMGREFKNNPFSTTAKTVASITLPSVLLAVVNNQDPRYKEIPQWEKDLFWIVMTKDHIWRIPKPFELGILFGTVPERIVDKVMNKNPHAFDGLLSVAGQGLTPSVVPTAGLPIMENWANKSYFTNRPLVPESKTGLLPQYQYTNYTTETAKQLGKLISKLPAVGDTGLASPADIENLVRGWTGGLGMLALKASDAALKKAGVGSNEVKPAATFADIPVLKAFSVRYPSASAESIQDFYNGYDSIQSIMSTGKSLAKSNQGTEAINVVKGNATNKLNPFTLKQVNKYHQALINANHVINTIYNNPNITADDKRKMIDNIYLQMIAVARQGNTLLEALVEQ